MLSVKDKVIIIDKQTPGRWHITDEMKKWVGCKAQIETIHLVQQYSFTGSGEHRKSAITPIYSLKGIKSAHNMPFWFIEEDLQITGGKVNGKN